MDAMNDRVGTAMGAASALDEDNPPIFSIAKILVVDDDARSLYALERILERDDVEILTARTGEEALKSVLNHDLALILLDVRMPGMNGYETAALIRKREKSRHIPIIFLTAVDKDDVHMFRGYTAGAVDYVFKPVEPLILKSKVSVFVELFRKSQEIRYEERAKRRLEAENTLVRNQKHRAELALRLSEERQSLILDSLPLALYSASPSGILAGRRLFGERAENICGFPAKTFDGTDDFWASHIHADDRQRALSAVASIATAGAFATEYRWLCADGSYRIFLDRAVEVRDRDGVAQEIFGLWLDVTEHRRLEQQLVHAQKMDAVGRLTGGIAHDFSNMLTAVLGNLDLLRRSLEPDSKAAKRTETALQSALRCADLTQRLLYFARQEPIQRDAVDIAAVVVGMKEIFSRTLDESIDVDVRLAADLWCALGDRSQLESALLNLVVNARDSFTEGGRLIIEAANVSLAEPLRDEHFQADAGDYVMLAVTDNGSGMPPAVQARIFEPFFTTKEPGAGTGLGLSMTYAFVQKCGGFIRIESELGRGTTVRLFLKRSGEPGAVARAAEAGCDGPRARGKEAILVVEDDADVLSATSEALREFGYEVLQATTARAALEVLASGTPVDLVFTDIAMPGRMSGRDLAREVEEHHPSVRILFTSGYARRAIDLGDCGMRAKLLRKPYRDYELAVAVREILDGRPPTAAAAG